MSESIYTPWILIFLVGCGLAIWGEVVKRNRKH